jgi:hypothetical protein
MEGFQQRGFSFATFSIVNTIDVITTEGFTSHIRRTGAAVLNGVLVFGFDLMWIFVKLGKTPRLDYEVLILKAQWPALSVFNQSLLAMLVLSLRVIQLDVQERRSGKRTLLNATFALEWSDTSREDRVAGSSEN